MIKIKIELHPMGDSTQKCSISTIEIANIGLAEDNKYAYKYRIFSDRHTEYRPIDPPYSWSSDGVPVGYLIGEGAVSHSRSLGILPLIENVLKEYRLNA